MEGKRLGSPCPKGLLRNTGVHRGVLDEYFTALFNNVHANSEVQKATNVCVVPVLEHRSLLQGVQNFMVFGFRLAVFQSIFCVSVFQG